VKKVNDPIGKSPDCTSKAEKYLAGKKNCGLHIGVEEKV
jgi:hypothetical protein